MKRILIAVCIAMMSALPALAQDWPTKTVKLIVPFAAGSTPDVVGRMLTDYLQSKLGQPFVVENRPGASGNTGTDAVAKAEPDGYTLGMSILGPLGVNAILFGSLPYDPLKDLAFVTMLVTQPSALAVNTSLNVNSVPELITLLKNNPGKYNFGSIGNGSLSHLSMEAILLKAGSKAVHIPYPGSPAAMTALMRNDVQTASLPAIAVTPHVASGQIKILAITTAKRSDLMPGIPTLLENGIDVQADAWSGLIAPAKTPDAIIEKIRAAFTEAVTSPGIREKIAIQITEPIPTTPAQFRARVEADIARWKPVIEAANIKVN
ncbi:MAG: Bug family tripartite tricarboxylate transporter substrate binding protein [Xanthobacteraceae bacterium]